MTSTRHAPPWPAPPVAEAPVIERLRWYTTVARLAPSKHNTQPWRFVVRADSLELWTDPRRALPTSDPKMRELVISCGAALHHVEVAADALGRRVRVEQLPEGGSAFLARIVEVGERPVTEHDQAMLTAVGHRHTDRGPLDATVLDPGLPFRLQSAAAGFGVTFRLVAGIGDRATLASLVARADRMLVRDDGFEQELSGWLRTTDDPRPDGVPDDRGRGAAASYRAEFVQRDFSGGRGQASHDRPGTDAPLLGVLCTPGDSVADWVAAGRALSAILLEASVAGGNASYLNQPVEVTALRHQLRSDLELGAEPQLVLRVGAGGPVQPTARRAIEYMRFDPVRSILVGVRGGSDLDPALDFALEEAVRRRLPLDAVHCYQLPSCSEWPTALARRLDDRCDLASRVLSGALERAVERVPGAETAAVRPRVIEGLPAECLLSLVTATAMLVVGTRGGGALRRTARGSVSAQVLHRSWAPVVLVPHAAPAVPDRWLRSRVVAALDGSPASLTALTWAVAQALEWGSQLAPVVVSSVTGRPPVGFRGSLGETVRDAVREAGGQSLEVHPHYLEGAPTRALLSLVEPEDLLVMGSRGRSGTASLFLGSTSTYVGEHAPCPVVVVREGQARREIHQHTRRTRVLAIVDRDQGPVLHGSLDRPGS